MPAIQTRPLPTSCLLARYAAEGAFTDCYATELPPSVPHAALVEALYRGPLMQIERRLIGWLLARPTSIDDVRALARGNAARFAAWQVEARRPCELLLQDQTGRTRSWLMTDEPTAGVTRLYFGSALLPRVDARSGDRHMGPLFRPLLGFHKLYSRLLLASARARLSRPASTAP